MRDKIILILAVISPIMILGLINALRKEADLRLAERELERDIASLERENAKLKDTVQYFSLKANIEREVRSRLNLAKPGETAVMFILPSPVPPSTSSAEAWLGRFWDWLRHQDR